MTAVVLLTALPDLCNSQSLPFQTPCPHSQRLTEHLNDSAGPHVYSEEDSLDTPPRLLTHVGLTYPPEAASAGYEARVLLTAIIEPDSAVSHAKVLSVSVSDSRWQLAQPQSHTGDNASPERMVSKGEVEWRFRRSALGYLEQARFTPGMKSGHPVRTFVCVPVDYRLH
jgi:hypothetical protein